MTARHLRFGFFAAVMITLNWGAFLWAVDNGHTVEAALGYFFVPLLSVAVGVGLLGERLHRLQKLALVFGTIGLLWTMIAVGTFPWVALVIGVSFTAYGWARKQGPWGALDGLTLEMAVIAPVFVVALVVRGAGSGVDIAGDGSLFTVLLVALTGVVTVVPLLLFASAARQVSLTVIGLMQYINPVMHFLIGWQVFGEDVSTGRLLGFGWIWMALALVIANEFRSKRPVDRLAARRDEGIVRS
jgi:chloramphenicol-sensitive protein RarD